MELTPEILKSIESGAAVVMSTNKLYALKYNGVIFVQNSYNVRLFGSKGAAKTALTKFIELVFRQGEYWQSCSTNLKKNSGYDVDFSGTISILPSYGKTARFEDPNNKKMFKDLATELLNQKVFTIEEI